jgi:hypothetical protein
MTHTVHTARRCERGVEGRVVIHGIVVLPFGQHPGRVVLKPDPGAGGTSQAMQDGR